MVNRSKLDSYKSWHRWRESGAVGTYGRSKLLENLDGRVDKILEGHGYENIKFNDSALRKLRRFKNIFEEMIAFSVLNALQNGRDYVKGEDVRVGKNERLELIFDNRNIWDLVNDARNCNDIKNLKNDFLFGFNNRAYDSGELILGYNYFDEEELRFKLGEEPTKEVVVREAKKLVSFLDNKFRINFGIMEVRERNENTFCRVCRAMDMGDLFVNNLYKVHNYRRDGVRISKDLLCKYEGDVLEEYRDYLIDEKK